MHEISNHKAVSVAQALNCFLVILTALVALPILNSDYAFLAFGALNTVFTVAAAIWMKETKGLTETEIARLYLKEEKLAHRRKAPSLEENEISIMFKSQ